MEFEERIGYRFRDRGLLETALTHSSYANESKTPIPNNERLEFLGDAVLSIVVSDYLFHRFHMAEGDLTKLRASIVCEKGLFQIASHIGLAQEIRLRASSQVLLITGLDTDNSRRLRELVPPGVQFVAESGVKGPGDVARLRDMGADGVLVGETLMRAADKGAKLRELRGDQ